VSEPELPPRYRRIEAARRYEGVKGVTLFLDKEEGKRKILPTAFYLALKDMHPERYEHIESAPSVEELLKKHGLTDWKKLVEF